MYVNWCYCCSENLLFHPTQLEYVKVGDKQSLAYTSSAKLNWNWSTTHNLLLIPSLLFYCWIEFHTCPQGCTDLQTCKARCNASIIDNMLDTTCSASGIHFSALRSLAWLRQLWSQSIADVGSCWEEIVASNYVAVGWAKANNPDNRPQASAQCTYSWDWRFNNYVRVYDYTLYCFWAYMYTE